MVARLVLHPNSTPKEFLSAVFSPRYQMATPHRGFFEVVKLSFVPSAYAQSCGFHDRQCTQTGEVKQSGTIGPGGTYCNCPDCLNGPCTNYNCANETTKGCKTIGSCCQLGICPCTQALNCTP